MSLVALYSVYVTFIPPHDIDCVPPYRAGVPDGKWMRGIPKHGGKFAKWYMQQRLEGQFGEGVKLLEIYDGDSFFTHYVEE